MDFSAEELKMAQFFIDREGKGVLNSLRTMNFLADGIIDSLDMVSLAVHIETKFGKKIDLTDRGTLQALTKFDSLMSLVRT